MPLFVGESGTPTAPSIVFLHGATTAGWMWQHQIEAMQDFHCLNVDLPGHGNSSAIEWVSLQDTVDQIAHVIQTRATNQRAFIVGLSLGSYVGLWLLARYSTLIERAVLSGVAILPLPNPWLMKLQLYPMSMLMKYSWFIRMQAQMLKLPVEAEAHYYSSMKAMRRQTLRLIFAELLNFQAPAHLERIQVPTLLSAGGNEAKVIIDSVRWLSQTMPHAQSYLAEGLHHGWNGENPALFSAMLRTWFTGQGCQPETSNSNEPGKKAQLILQL